MHVFSRKCYKVKKIGIDFLYTVTKNMCLNACTRKYISGVLILRVSYSYFFFLSWLFFSACQVTHGISLGENCTRGSWHATLFAVTVRFILQQKHFLFSFPFCLFLVLHLKWQIILYRCRAATYIFFPSTCLWTFRLVSFVGFVLFKVCKYKAKTSPNTYTKKADARCVFFINPLDQSCFKL